MKLYKVKIQANDNSIFEFMKFAEKNGVTIYITYQQEDIFADIVFLFVSVEANSVVLFEAKYAKNIVSYQTL